MALDTKTTSNSVDDVGAADQMSMDDQAVPKSTITTDQVDAGLDLYTQALELDAEHLQQLARSVRRKLDLILLPLVLSFCCLLIEANYTKACIRCVRYTSSLSWRKRR
jgi:hypothetical protein